MGSCCFIFFIFIILEICVRFATDDYPENYLSVNYYPVQKNEKRGKLEFDHTPDWSGYATGVKISLNEAGLRDIPEKKYSHKNLILFSGDSIFFGYGLRDKFVITNYLNKKRNQGNDYFLNNGVCGYNLIQSFEKTKNLLERYKTVSYVFYSFIHNDIEGLFQSVQPDTGFLPAVKSAYFIEPDKNTFLYRLLNMILPDDMTNPKFAAKTGIRKLLIKHSRLYAFVALNLKKICWSFGSSEIKLNYWLPELKVSDTIIYEPLLQTALQIKKYMESKNIKYSIVIPLDMIISGRPLKRIIESFEKNGIKNYIAAAYMPEPDIYARKYILGWDSHPNRKGAEALASAFEKIYNYDSSAPADSGSNNAFVSEYSLKSKKYFQEHLNGSNDFEKMIASTTIMHKSIILNNNYLNSNHFVYGVWDHFPLINGKINVRMDGVWVSKYLSFCVSSPDAIRRFKFYYDDFHVGRNSKIFINKIEVPFNVKATNSGGFIEIINDFGGIIHSEPQKKFFYEIYFEFENCFKDDNNRIFGPFIKKIEFD